MSLGAIQSPNLTSNLSLLYSAVTPNSMTGIAQVRTQDSVDLSEDAQNYLKQYTQTRSVEDPYNKGSYAAATIIEQRGNVLDIKLSSTTATRQEGFGNAGAQNYALAEHTHVRTAYNLAGVDAGEKAATVSLSAEMSENGSTRFNLTISGNTIYLGESAFGGALSGAVTTPQIAGDVIWKYGSNTNPLLGVISPADKAGRSPIIAQNGPLGFGLHGISLSGASAGAQAGRSNIHLTFSIDKNGLLLDPSKDDLSRAASQVNVTISMDQLMVYASAYGDNYQASAQVMSMGTEELAPAGFSTRPPSISELQKTTQEKPKIALATDAHAFSAEDIRINIAVSAKYRELQMTKEIVDNIDA